MINTTLRVNIFRPSPMTTKLLQKMKIPPKADSPHLFQSFLPTDVFHKRDPEKMSEFQSNGIFSEPLLSIPSAFDMKDTLKHQPWAPWLYFIHDNFEPAYSTENKIFCHYTFLIDGDYPEYVFDHPSICLIQMYDLKIIFNSEKYSNARESQLFSEVIDPRLEGAHKKFRNPNTLPALVDWRNKEIN